MKKLIIMLVLVVLVMGLTITAQAELRFKDFVEDYTHYDETETVRYYATIVSDSGDEQRIELSQQEWTDLKYKWKKINAKEDQAVRFANRNWYENIVPTITFWDLYD